MERGVTVESLSLQTTDGVTLEAERAVPAGLADATSRASVVLCHPHPQYGGTMRSIVIGALFDALPAIGCTVLRFNFRGVERSTGTHDEGRNELLDAEDIAFDELEHAYEDGDRSHFESDLSEWKGVVERRLAFLERHGLTPSQATLR